METPAPNKTINDYTKLELETFQKQFLPIVEKYNKRADLAKQFMYVFVGCTICGVTLRMIFGGNKLFLISLLTALGAWVTSALISLSFTAHCPACAQAVEKIAGAYCPVCGAKAIKRGFFVIVPSCQSCGTEFGYRK